MRAPRPVVIGLLCPVFVAIAASGARAQEGEAEPAPLSGPDVPDVRPEQLEQGLTAGPGPGMRMGVMRALPQRDVREVLEALAADDADASVRLSAAQQDRFRTLNRAHQAEVRAYREQHAERIQSLRMLGGIAPARIADEDLSGAQRDARVELQRLMRAGPAWADLQTRVFAELTPAQRAHIDAEIARRADERYRERRERAYAEQLAAAPVDPSAFFNERGGVDMQDLPAPLRRRLADVPEPRRADRLRRMLDRLERRRSADGSEDEAAPAPTDKRPPPADSIDVPEPEPERDE